jgi:hypothetical protein
MPELSLSDDQHDRLEEVRHDIETAFVDSYGHTRMEDALEYLLDTYTPPEEREDVSGAYERIAAAEYPALQRVASDVQDVPGSGIDADEMRGKLLVELGHEEFADKLDAQTEHEDDTRPESESRDEEQDDTRSRDEEQDGTHSGDESSDSEDESIETDDQNGDNDGGGGGGDGGSGGGGGGLLSAANRLLEEHDERWRRSSGEAPYEVDLPDGTTAQARTKDDVRQLLFRHYRG